MQEAMEDVWKTKEKLDISFTGNEELLEWLVFHDYNGLVADCDNLDDEYDYTWWECPEGPVSDHMLNTFYDRKPFESTS